MIDEKKWTTDYPTKPGFYWVRNYVFNAANGYIDDPAPAPDIAEIKKPDGEHALAAFWTGSERYWNQAEFLSAEWYGPLEPPE